MTRDEQAVIVITLLIAGRGLSAAQIENEKNELKAKVRAILAIANEV